MEDSQNEIRLREAASKLGVELLSLQDTKKEASKLLLQGWKMTNELCPVSEYPLFKNKDVLWSVRLGMPIKRQGETTKQGMVVENMAEQQQQQHQQEKETEEPDDITSQRIGQKLLLGWTMTAETCPFSHASPLMRDPTSNRLWTPTYGKYIDECVKEQSEEMRIDADEKKQNNLPTNNRPSSDHLQLISRRIGEKLLLGWTMMEKSCPETGACPLMEEPGSGRLYSAAVDAFVNDGAKTTTSPPTRKKKDPSPPTDPYAIVQEKMSRWSIVLATLSDTELPDLDKSLVLMKLLREAAAMLNER